MHRSLRQNNSRFDKVVNGLIELCSRKNLKETITVNDNSLIIRSARPKLWETLFYPTPIIALWAWYFIDKSKDDFGFIALLGLSVYWIWVYFEIEIINLDRIGSYFYKPVLFKIDPENRVFEKEKRFSRLSKTNRISVQTKSEKLTLIDIDDFFASNRFKFALTYLVTTKRPAQ